LALIETSHGDLRLLAFERLSQAAGFRHAITTRPQNYAPHRGSGRADAVRWRKRVCEILGVGFEPLTSPEQVHGAEVLALKEADLGCGRDGRQSAVRFVDGLMTQRRGVPLVLLSADCPLVCAYDPVAGAIGAVHASWQGTVARAAENLVHQMERSFGSAPGRLLVGIAPSAGPCCYEVGEHVRRIARTRLDDTDSCFVTRGGRIVFDLWESNVRQLMGAGVPREQIEVAGVCTICDPRFWSHRRDGSEAGRNALFLALA